MLSTTVTDNEKETVTKIILLLFPIKKDSEDKNDSIKQRNEGTLRRREWKQEWG